MTPHQILGQTVGFDLTVTSDCAYGFTGIITQKAILNKSAPSLEFHIQSDVNTCILPRIRIKSTGNFHISNVNDFGHPETIFKNLPADQSLEFIMNSDTDTIFIQKAGVTAPLPDPNMFNWHFLRLVDGKNQIMIHTEADDTKTEAANEEADIAEVNNIEIEIEIQYREPRRIII